MEDLPADSPVLTNKQCFLVVGESVVFDHRKGDIMIRAVRENPFYANAKIASATRDWLRNLSGQAYRGACRLREPVAN